MIARQATQSASALICLPKSFSNDVQTLVGGRRRDEFEKFRFFGGLLLLEADSWR